MKFGKQFLEKTPAFRAGRLYQALSAAPGKCYRCVAAKRQKAKKENNPMSLKGICAGIALVFGVSAGPGLYYMTQEPEIVRAKVTGKVQADADATYPGQKYFIYTKEGKFDTFATSKGDDLKEGCVYDFNLKGARFQWQDISYSRSVAGVKIVPSASPLYCMIPNL